MRRTTLAALATTMAMIMPSVASAQTAEDPAPIVVDDAAIDQFQLMVRSFMRIYLGATVDSDAFQIRLRECITNALQTQTRIQLRAHAETGATYRNQTSGQEPDRDQMQDRDQTQERDQTRAHSSETSPADGQSANQVDGSATFRLRWSANGLRLEGSQNQWGQIETG